MNAADQNMLATLETRNRHSAGRYTASMHTYNWIYVELYRTETMQLHRYTPPSKD